MKKVTLSIIGRLLIAHSAPDRETVEHIWKQVENTVVPDDQHVIIVPLISHIEARAYQADTPIGMDVGKIELREDTDWFGEKAE